MWLGIGVLVLVLAAVAIMGFVTPGWFTTKVFDTTKVEEGVKGILTSSYQIQDVASVECPAEQKVEAGTTFECTATIAGAQKKVQIKVTSDEGAYEVGKPA